MRPNEHDEAMTTEGRETMLQVKALNARLRTARTGAERECLESLVVAAKADWSRRVAPAMAALWRQMGGGIEG